MNVVTATITQSCHIEVYRASYTKAASAVSIMVHGKVYFAVSTVMHNAVFDAVFGKVNGAVNRSVREQEQRDLALKAVMR